LGQTREKIDTVVIGAGQAGLCMSYHLRNLNRQHIVLERGRIGESWRSERWDSLRFQFESSIANLPGFPFSGKNEQDFMPRNEVVNILDGYASHIRAPVRCGVDVKGLVRREDGKFLVRCDEHDIEAQNVVVATGPYQRAIVPEFSVAVPKQVMQLPANKYCNPEQLPSETTLVVGGGSSGYQIAEDLLESGRRVILATGRHRALPRRYRGHDLGHWLQSTGLLEQKVEDMTLDLPTVLLSGYKRGEMVDIRWLAQRGVQIVGKLERIEGDTLTFKQNLSEVLAESDAHVAGFKAMVDEHAGHFESDAMYSETDAPPPLGETARSLTFTDSNITSVIWAIGYKFDFGWIDLDVFDPTGAPLHRRGVTNVPGFYFLGLQYLSKLKSAFFWGSGEDAEFLAEEISDRVSI
jgi:putative flavoprotein involved in K+ transport